MAEIVARVRGWLAGDRSALVLALVAALRVVPEVALAVRIALRVAPAWTRSERWSTRGGISWVTRVDVRLPAEGEDPPGVDSVWRWRALGCEGVEVARTGAESAADAILRGEGFALATHRVSWCRECERTMLRIEASGVGVCPICLRVHERP